MTKYATYIFATLFALVLYAVPCSATYAATLRVSPETGVYTVGGTFTTRVLINTGGAPINAAEGALTFNPRELQVVAVSKGNSIFNLWTIDPTFSNAAGKVTFGGGSPSGYTGAAGDVIDVTFRTLIAATPKVTFASGSVLAADGQGTNVLTSMVSGTYTVSAAASQPEPEYIAPANTPAAPNITSPTHPNQDAWYTATTAKVAWTIPSGITTMRMLVDDKRGTVPTVVYDTPIKEKELTNLKGVSYVHVQFKNKDGWGKIGNFRIAVDTGRPESFTIALEAGDAANPKQRLHFDAKDSGSGISYYMVQLDGSDRAKWVDDAKKGIYELSALPPGDHTVVAEAFDQAGNSLIASLSFKIDAFEAPKFTDYPERIQSNIIPVIKGTTRPDAHVHITLAHSGSDTAAGGVPYEVVSDAKGSFIFIPNDRLAIGVYEVSAKATDIHGAESLPSDKIRILVEEPGYVKAGATAVGILSVAVPLVALIVLLGLILLFGWSRARLMRMRLRKEITEAEKSLAKEFSEIINGLDGRIEELKADKQGKMTKSEISMLSTIAKEIVVAKNRVEKEIEDIEHLVTKR